MRIDRAVAVGVHHEPGLEHAETIESGAKAAAAGGFTIVCTLPQTQPVNDSATVTSFLVDRAARQSYATILPIGAMTIKIERGSPALAAWWRWAR